MNDFQDAWTGAKIPTESLSFETRISYEFEVQPLEALLQECFGRDYRVALSWPETCENGISYRSLEVTIYIYNVQVCTGSLLKCTRALLQMVQNYLRIK